VKLSQLATSLSSKNAGNFHLTFDIVFDSADTPVSAASGALSFDSIDTPHESQESV